LERSPVKKKNIVSEFAVKQVSSADQITNQILNLKELIERLPSNHPQRPHLLEKLDALSHKGGISNFASQKQADLEGIKPLPSIKPLKFPGDLDANLQTVYCRQCGCQMKSPNPNKDEAGESTCPNCSKMNAAKVVGTEKHQPDPKGKQYNPFGLQHLQFAPRNVPLAAYNQKKVVEGKKKKKEKPRARDTFMSEEVKMCPDILEVKKRKKNRFVDNSDEVMKSCLDLAIDG